MVEMGKEIEKGEKNIDDGAADSVPREDERRKAKKRAKDPRKCRRK